MHYNSVRAADDFSTVGPPERITLRVPSTGSSGGGGVLGTADEPEESEVSLSIISGHVAIVTLYLLPPDIRMSHYTIKILIFRR